MVYPFIHWLDIRIRKSILFSQVMRQTLEMPRGPPAKTDPREFLRAQP